LFTTGGWCSHWYYFKTLVEAIEGAALLDAVQGLSTFSVHTPEDSGESFLVVAWAESATGAASHPEHTMETGKVKAVGGIYDGCEHNIVTPPIIDLATPCEPLQLLAKELAKGRFPI
jgi:hypothetical protein